jgi:hypothetical protein
MEVQGERVRRRRRAVLLGAAVSAAALAGLVAGCGAPTAGGIGDDVHRHAEEELAAYAKAVAAADPALNFAVVGETVQQVGDWELAVGAANKQALLARLVAPTAQGEQQMAAATPPDPQLLWPDGHTTAVDVSDAAATLTEFTRAAPPENACAGCPALMVQAAAPVTMTLTTSKGPVQAPAWRYTLAGTQVRLVMPAFAPGSLISVPVSDGPGGDVEVDSVSVPDRRARTLTAHFGGAVGDGSQPCGEDYAAAVVESAAAVVVIVTASSSYSGDAMCAMPAADRAAQAELHAPLGERAVLEVSSGQPLPVTVTR